MARKVFVSYKHGDTQVKPLIYPFNSNGTCRDYVDVIMALLDGIEIYKGEDGDNDMSKFKDETIRTHLKEKIRDSSVTVVLVSKGMKQYGVNERDQWIPWEVKYSLLRKAYGEKRSNSNGMLAVIIPESDGTYNHYFEYTGCAHCGSVTHKTTELFEILKNNMFNRHTPQTLACSSLLHESRYHSGNNHSYIHQVKWDDFIQNPSMYLDIAERNRNNITDFKLQKKVLVN